MHTRAPRILMLTHRVPYPPDKGDRIRSYQLLRFLAGQGEVHLATLADEPVTAETLAELGRWTARVTIGDLGEARGAGRKLKGLTSLLLGGTVTESMFHSRFLQEEVRRWTAEVAYSAVVAFSSATAQYVPEGPPVVADICDVDSEKWLQYAASARFPLSTLFRTEGRRLRRIEARLGTASRVVTLVTRPEQELYRSFCPAARTEVVPIGVDLEYLQPAYIGERNRLVFVGTLDYRPNVQGIIWFCETVWPEVRARFRRATLFVVGRNPVTAVRALERIPGIQVVGPVPDVRPYLRRAAVSIAPLHIARGLQTKVLEALAMGKAVVATPQAAEGIDIRHGEEVLVADSAEEWVHWLGELLCEDGLRRRLGKAGRRFVETHHCWDACFAPLQRILSSILGRQGSGIRNQQSDRASALVC